jgi:hypothetical protein
MHFLRAEKTGKCLDAVPNPDLSGSGSGAEALRKESREVAVESLDLRTGRMPRGLKKLLDMDVD